MTAIPSSSSQRPSDAQHDSEKLADLFDSLMIDAQRLAQTLANGFHGRKRAGIGENFWQHRPYVSGDQLNDIDWRQSARAADRLYIRQNEWEAANAVWLWRDPSASMAYASREGLDEKRHRASILTIALAILLSKGGERIGVLGAHPGHDDTSESSRLFHGRGAPAKILENLDHFNETPSSIIPRGEKTRPGHHMVLISDFLMESKHVSTAIEYALAKGASGILCQVLDPAEKSFPYRGRTEFMDMESPDRLLFGNAQSVRKEYQQVFSEHQEALLKISKATGWPLITHYTDSDAHTALSFIVSMLDKNHAPTGGNLR